MMITLNEDDIKKAIIRHLADNFAGNFEYDNVRLLSGDVNGKWFANVSVKETEEE